MIKVSPNKACLIKDRDGDYHYAIKTRNTWNKVGTGGFVEYGQYAEVVYEAEKCVECGDVFPANVAILNHCPTCAHAIAQANI